MARCAVQILRGANGEAKRVLVNGEPVPGLLKIQTAGGPRTPNTVVLTLHATTITNEVDPDGN